jgi:TetR/AcrR family transcriptional repressor of mexCD-oprJ operon
MISPIRAPRADAVRNRDSILDAALHRLGADPRASMTDIAHTAGVGRVTIYGHFSSREDLIEALLIRTIDRAETEFAALDLSGEPREALERLLRRSWRIVDTFNALLGVVEHALPNERIFAHHERPQARIADLLRRGQVGGVFRRDLDADWLTACITTILHTAAAELRTGRLAEDDADRVMIATVMSLVSSHG